MTAAEEAHIVARGALPNVRQTAPVIPIEAGLLGGDVGEGGISLLLSFSTSADSII